MTEVDFYVQNEGSIFLLTANSKAARDWADEHIHEATRWGKSIVVEHRYIANIVECAVSDGLVVE